MLVEVVLWLIYHHTLFLVPDVERFVRFCLNVLPRGKEIYSEKYLKEMHRREKEKLRTRRNYKVYCFENI